MLGSAVPAAATLHTSTSSVTSSSPSRPSRLRGLSYLRSYTRDHFHSLASTSPTHGETPPLTRSNSPPLQSEIHSREAGQPSPVVSPIQNSEHGWVPSVQGRSGLDRDPRHPTSTSTESASPEPSNRNLSMTRSRTAVTSGPTPASSPAGAAPPSTAPAARETDTTTVMSPPNTRQDRPSTNGTKEPPPTIRFIPHIEARSSRPSLNFSALSRTLKDQNTVVRVGRYSERDVSAPSDNVLPIGFKSKVVSRRHCEFWCTNGQWYVKDVKSSSGTFLNHVRLSAPGAESRPFPVNDGDVVQLGIDFKGGEEVIFRCVKIRIECNRGWQKSLNSFNTTAHKRILRNALQNKVRDSDAASINSSECSICLNPVSPCQALFVAPCSHVWHYKCVRNLIHGPSYPNFLCPNCRFVADLDADVEPPEDELYEDPDFDSFEPQKPIDADVVDDDQSHGADASAGRRDSGPSVEVTEHPLTESRTNAISDEELSALLPQVTAHEPNATTEDVSSPSSATRPMPITTPPNSGRQTHEGDRLGTPETNAQFALATGLIHADLMTPRNDAGPFVLDGSAGRDEPTGMARQPLLEENEPSSPD